MLQKEEKPEHHAETLPTQPASTDAQVDQEVAKPAPEVEMKEISSGQPNQEETVAVKEETKAAEAKEETKAADAKEEVKAAEVKEEVKAAEVKAEKNKEETKEQIVQEPKTVEEVDNLKPSAIAPDKDNETVPA